MSSSSTTSTSSSAPISNLITVATFNGQSKFSADFQNVLTRAVNLQSLNLQSLQQQQTTDQNQQSAVQALDQTFSALQTSIDALTTSTGIASLGATVSNPAVASVSLSNGAAPATYKLEVTNAGSQTQTYSSNGLPTVTDPSSQNISTSTSFSLTVGSNAYSLSATTLQGLANDINANPSMGASASIVNVGNSTSPDYRLAVQATALGSTNIQLNDGTNNLLTTSSTGSPATYYVDGDTNLISSTTDSIALAPGVTVNLLGTNTGSPATITVAQNSTSIQNALQSFAISYNSVVDQMNTSHGPKANVLQGDSIIYSAQTALRSIIGYNDGNMNGLSYLGLDLDTAGHLTFNAAEFQASSAQGLSAITSFLGDSTTGFIQAASNAVAGVEDPVTGSIKLEEQQQAATLASLSSKISEQVSNINLFQQNLVQQLAAADANIYTLENQATYYQGLFNYNNNSSSNG